MGSKTRVRSIVHETGQLEFCPQHPRQLLCQVTDGPHEGTRGCTECLTEIVGEVRYDKSRAYVIETGRVVGWGYVGRKYEQTANSAWTEYQRMRRFVESRESALQRSAPARQQNTQRTGVLWVASELALVLLCLSVLLIAVAWRTQGFWQSLFLHLGIELAGVALTVALLDLLWKHRGD